MKSSPAESSAPYYYSKTKDANFQAIRFSPMEIRISFKSFLAE